MILKGKNVAIVGSNRGIGLELVRHLIAEERRVFAFCRETSRGLGALKPAAIIENFNVTDPEIMRAKIKELGNERIDWLIHVSGILRNENLAQLTQRSLIRQMSVNAIGPILTVQTFLPYLAQPSKIGLLTSRLGSITENTSGSYYGYRMSKSALNMAGKSLSKDLRGRGTAVFLLHPGYVKTEMTGFSGDINASESARGLIKLMNEKSLRETGTFWHVSGRRIPW